MENLLSDHLLGIEYDVWHPKDMCFPTVVCKFSENDFSIKMIFASIFLKLPEFSISII